ncbi:MAG TPA: histidine--tRNA ligase [Thermoplasmata archaeon]|nr:histidine--tRNA ligase [Thermoplasmata archaeon]
MPFTSLRGFRDYPPPEGGARSEILRRMRSVARRCGFQELETPSVESLELYKVKSGEEIGKEVWGFVDKGGREVALTPETTPSLARIFVDRAKSEPLPVKWFTISKLWRYEEPQAGRTREFTQFNLDILGVEGIEADAEILATSALILDEAGAQGLYAFRLNDRELADALGAHFGATDRPRYFRALDRYRKEERSVTAAELAASGVADDAREKLLALLEETRAGVPVAEAADLLDRMDGWALPDPGPRALARLRKLLDTLDAVGVADRVFLDLTVVRGLAYYTSTVFEAFDRAGEQRALFGGGRYDQLVELFGGPPTPACGLAIGDQTLEILLRAHERWPRGEPGLDTYVVAVTPAEVPMALRWVRRLRAAGLSADCDLMARSLSRQLKEAARRGSRRAILLGPRELARGVVVERDLTTGAQRECPPEELLPGA